MILTEAFDYFAAAFRTFDSDMLAYRLRIFAFREVTAGIEFAVAARTDDHIAAAKLAFHISLFRFDLFVLYRLIICIYRNGIFAFGIIDASGKSAESALADDHFAAAFFADHITFLKRNLNLIFADMFLCLFKRLFEIAVKFGQNFFISFLAACYFIEVILHIRREFIIDNMREILFHQLYHCLAERCGFEQFFIALNITAVYYRGYGGSIGAGACDAFFLENLDERAFCIM